jgi:hypothetical protein
MAAILAGWLSVSMADQNFGGPAGRDDVGKNTESLHHSAERRLEWGTRQGFQGGRSGSYEHTLRLRNACAGNDVGDP